MGVNVTPISVKLHTKMVKLTPTGVKINTNLVWSSHNPVGC